jgi:hypothetical protein
MLQSVSKGLLHQPLLYRYRGLNPRNTGLLATLQFTNFIVYCVKGELPGLHLPLMKALYPMAHLLVVFSSKHCLMIFSSLKGGTYKRNNSLLQEFYTLMHKAQT